MKNMEDEENDPNELFQLASPVKRLANYLIDTSVIVLVVHTVSLFIFEYIKQTEWTVYALIFSILIFYYTLLESITGKTIGKMLTGTLVVDEDGYKVPFGRIVLRTICRLIPFYQFSLIFGDPEGWHDLISKTRVVEPAYDED